jgi:hypothetical protein
MTASKPRGALARLAARLGWPRAKRNKPASNVIPATWKDIEYFDETWKNRIRQMAGFIPPKSRVLDLGCGEMRLREFLKHCVYIPVDYMARGPETIVCDFNRGEFPNVPADVSFVSGCLEYIENPSWFIGQIAAHSQICVISYCSIEHFDDPSQRAAAAWKNSFDAQEVISLFLAKGMTLSARTFLPESKNTVFRFVAGPPSETPRS